MAVQHWVVGEAGPIIRPISCYICTSASISLSRRNENREQRKFLWKDSSELSTIYIMSFIRIVTFGISGRAKIPVAGWVTRHLCLVQFSFNKLLSLSFHFLPPADMHKVHCEINGVLKWLLTMSSYWYVFSWNNSTKYFFLPYSSLPKSNTKFCLRVKMKYLCTAVMI